MLGIFHRRKEIIFDMWIFRESSNKCFAFIPQMFRIWCKNYSNVTKKTNDSFMTYHFINTTTLILLNVVSYSCIINMVYIFLEILFDMYIHRSRFNSRLFSTFEPYIINYLIICRIHLLENQNLIWLYFKVFYTKIVHWAKDKSAFSRWLNNVQWLMIL